MRWAASDVSPSSHLAFHIPNTCRVLFVVCCVLGLGGLLLCCVFGFLFCKCFGIPNSPRSLDLDDRQGLIASSAMQQKKKLQAFLSPLLPQGLSCLSLQMWHNGAAVDYQLVSCFNGFFIQITAEVNSILMENIRLAAPLIIPQLHIDQMVLTDPQLLQVTAFVPGGDTLISSRSLTMTEKRNRVFTILDSLLRQRFADMRNVGFLLLTAHPSSKWMDPAFSPQKEKVVVVVYSDEVLQGSASVLLRLGLPPHDAEGAIYVRRRLRLRYLIRQLGISLLCGDAGAECLCYVNGMELSNDREMAVSWMQRNTQVHGVIRTLKRSSRLDRMSRWA